MGRTNEDILYAAQRAYAAYGSAVDWTSVSNSPMPRWEDLGERVQGAWLKAVGVVIATADAIHAGRLPLHPKVSANVHYVSRGSADGVYSPACRAAVINQVCTPEYLGSSQSLDDEQASTVGLFVMNPEGTYHLTLEGTGGCRYRPVDHLPLEGGTWHYPQECA